MTPQIVIPTFEGKHNASPDTTEARLEKSQAYQDLSTLIICPTRGTIPAKVVLSWMSMIRPMNQKIIGPMFAIGLEVGSAYNGMIESILANPGLASFRYILTIEEDNTPPPDGLLKLYETIEGQVDGQKYDVVGGLYFTKGEMGQPMIYGDPKVFPRSFVPQKPKPEKIVPCHGLGMGFTLFRMSVFHTVPKPWFKTRQEFIPGKGTVSFSQDLYFFEESAKKGIRVASDCRVKVGHYDLDGAFGEPDTLW